MKKLLPLIFLFSLILPSSIFSQESITITAIPPRLELQALPGVTLQESIKIRNESNTEMAFQINSSDFIVSDNKGTPVAVTQAVSGRWSLSSWVTFSPKKILLQPQETRMIDLVINIPQDALAGGHYAMITYSPDLTGMIGDQGSASTITQKVGTLIYFNVIGDVVEAANLKEFKVDNFFSNYGPINLTAEIENLGDIHFAPTGNITITNLLNKSIFTASLEPTNIFPFASRIFSWQVPGKYRFGRYMAKLEATAGTNQLPLNGLIYFWIVPVKEVALALGVIILILIIIIVKRRRKPTPTPPLEPTLEPEIN